MILSGTPRKIRVMITTFRDGLQSSFGGKVRLEAILPAMEAAARAGIRHFEFGGGARYQAPYFYGGEDPFVCMDEMRRVLGQTDDQCAFRPQQLIGQRTSWNHWDVRGFDPAIGQVNAGWRLRRARHANQYHIGLVQIALHLSIVVGQGEIHRIHALKILGIKSVLQAGPPANFDAEVTRQTMNDRI